MTAKPLVFALYALTSLVLALNHAAPAAAAPARVAISAFQINSHEDLGYIQTGLSALLPPRISLPGKIVVVDNSAVRQSLSTPRSDYSPDQKTRLTRELELDYLLTGSLTKIGDTISIDAVLFDAAQPEQSTPLSVSTEDLNGLIAQVQVLATSLQRHILYGSAEEAAVPPPPVPAPAAAEPAWQRPQASAQHMPATPPPAVPPAPPQFTAATPVFKDEPDRKHVITHAPFICMATGDLTGQGRKQLLLADHRDVQVYDFTPDGLVLMATIKTKTDEYIITIDTFDLNANSRDEIYISSSDGQRTNSFAVEYTGETYARIAEQLPWFIKTYPNRDSRVLLGVKEGAYNIFYGSTFEFIWKDGTPRAAAEFPLPSGVSPFGSSSSDIDGDRREEYIAFSRGTLGLDYHLHVLSNTGRILWKDTQSFGGEPNSFTRRVLADVADTEEPIPLRVYCADITGDGRTEILLPRNTKKSTGLLSRMASYNQGEMLCLHWDGSSLVQNWSSREQDGYISDFLITDIDGDGNQELIILSVSGHSLTGKADNTLGIYKQAR
jgi:TolB-like protein